MRRSKREYLVAFAIIVMIGLGVLFFNNARGMGFDVFQSFIYSDLTIIIGLLAGIFMLLAVKEK